MRVDGAERSSSAGPGSGPRAGPATVARGYRGRVRGHRDERFRARGGGGGGVDGCVAAAAAGASRAAQSEQDSARDGGVESPAGYDSRDAARACASRGRRVLPRGALWARVRKICSRARELARGSRDGPLSPSSCLSRRGDAREISLHGTYFQTNEVFLDAETATRPHMVPARALDDLPTVSVFLGSSVHSITRGMSRAEVASAFADRAVCVRSWDHSQGGKPRPLPRWACPFLPRAATLGPAPGEEQTYAATTSGGIVVAPAAATAPVNVEEDPDEFDMDERWDAYLRDADENNVANAHARAGTPGGTVEERRPTRWDHSRIRRRRRRRGIRGCLRRLPSGGGRRLRRREGRRGGDAPAEREEQIRRERLGLDTPVVGDGSKRRRTVPVEETESIARYFSPAAQGAA